LCVLGNIPRTSRGGIFCRGEAFVPNELKIINNSEKNASPGCKSNPNYKQFQHGQSIHFGFIYIFYFGLSECFAPTNKNINIISFNFITGKALIPDESEITIKILIECFTRVVCNTYPSSRR